MPKRDLRFLIGRALTNDKFKKDLQKNPRATARKAKCKITSAQADVLKKMKEDDWEKIESVVYDTMIATSDCIA